MKVYVLYRNDYEQSGVEDVFSSVDAAMASKPDWSWKHFVDRTGIEWWDTEPRMQSGLGAEYSILPFSVSGG